MKTINNSEGQGSFPFRNAHSILNYFTTEINLNGELKMEEKLGIIYIPTNLINGKQYVGQTTRDLKERIKGHKKHGCLLHNAIKKYGFKNFKVISFSCPEKDLDWTETFLIKELNTLAPNGYNLQTGGSEFKHHHELTIQKMKNNHADVSGENNPMFGIRFFGKDNHKFGKGYLMTQENNPNFGNHWTQEQKDAQSDKLKGRFAGENNPNFGNKWTQEQKDAQSKRLKEIHKGEK